MRIKQALFGFILCLSPVYALNQQISAPEPQSGSIIGTVTDVDGDAVPGATVTVDGVDPSDRRTEVANDNAFFMLSDLTSIYLISPHHQRKRFCSLELAFSYPHAGATTGSNRHQAHGR
jgi:hypothetical protein